MKTEAYKLYSRVFWIFLPNFIKIAPCNFELYRFKVKTFFETQCSVKHGLEIACRLSVGLWRWWIIGGKSWKLIAWTIRPTSSLFEIHCSVIFAIAQLFCFISECRHTNRQTHSHWCHWYPYPLGMGNEMAVWTSMKALIKFGAMNQLKQLKAQR